MSEKSVILHEEITSSQADAVSVVGSARTHFAIFINLHVPLKKIFLDMGKESPGIRVKFRNSLLLEIMAKLMKMRGKGRHRSEGVDVVLGAPALAISGLELQGFNFSEIFREKDWRDRFCLSVFLTPLDLRNMTFQIFIPH